ncbi:hypothetical protein SCACP_10310 [Sporomusa carbonis]|uniref:hypothetical protein n=1 Tax=Sporomusa carbonis TaxID=3076075 RepID=UPI003A5E56D4
MKEESARLSHKVLLIALIIVIIAFLGMGLVDYYWISNSVWKQQIILLLGAIETSAIVVAVWEFAAKKTFAKEILDLAHISSNISKSGVAHIYLDFQDISWKPLLENTRNLKIAVTYANTWRESHRSLLGNFAKEKKNLIVFLPDFNDTAILNELALRFEINSEEVKQKIRESYDRFKKDMGASVFLYRGCFQSTYYLTDNIGIMSFFNHKKDKSTVPAIQVTNQGELYQYINSELEAIENNSYEWKEYIDEK